jgi:hypothetical protein
MLACRHAVLLPEEPSKASIEAGQAFLRQWQPALPGCDGILKLSGEDIWHNRILRWLTPLAEDKSSFQLLETAHETDLVLGSNRRLAFSDKKLSGLDRIYMESLRLYVLMPQLLARAENPVLLGPQSLGTQQYIALFFNLERGSWNNPELDQYIAYFRPDDHSLELVQFTYRDLTRSYVGWLRFGPRKDFTAFTYPATISILDDWNATESTHAIHLHEILCSGLSSN